MTATSKLTRTTLPALLSMQLGYTLWKKTHVLVYADCSMPSPIDTHSVEMTAVPSRKVAALALALALGFAKTTQESSE